MKYELVSTSEENADNKTIMRSPPRENRTNNTKRIIFIIIVSVVLIPVIYLFLPSRNAFRQHVRFNATFIHRNLYSQHIILFRPLSMKSL